MPAPTQSLDGLDLEVAIEQIIAKSKNDAQRLSPLADFCVPALERFGLPGVRGGSTGELAVGGIGRTKAWDVAYEFAGKFRLLVSLKSIWKNASGTVPNRIDDLMGEAANVQQLAPELVIGYVLVFDAAADSRRVKPPRIMWSEFFEAAVKRIAIREAPLWNYGLLEGTWFILIDSRNPSGKRLVDPAKAYADGSLFFRSLVRRLYQREPAIPFTIAPGDLG
jgi:hypothetical protein